MKYALIALLALALVAFGCKGVKKEGKVGTAKVADFSADEEIKVEAPGSDFSFEAEANSFAIEGATGEQKVEVKLTSVPQADFIDSLNTIGVGLEIAAGSDTKILETMTLELGKPDEIVTFNKDVTFAIDAEALTALENEAIPAGGTADEAIPAGMKLQTQEGAGIFGVAIVISSNNNVLGNVRCVYRETTSSRFSFTCSIKGSGLGPKVNFIAARGSAKDVSISVGDRKTIVDTILEVLNLPIPSGAKIDDTTTKIK